MNLSQNMTTNQRLIKGSDISNLSKKEQIMKHMMDFFSQDYNLNKLVPIIKHDKTSNEYIPLRVIEWFVTNYSKQHTILYNIQKCISKCKPHECAHMRQFSVYTNYKAQLKTYTKKMFDPFRRGGLIYFEYAPDKGFNTTPGQLNFFCWAIENKVLEYIKNHLKEITEDMNIRGPKIGDKEQRKKHELSVAATKSLSQHDVKIAIKFDL
jgi:hypothetical protein